jgi:DNA-binding NarL/FixJ family response regulator
MPCSPVPVASAVDEPTGGTGGPDDRVSVLIVDDDDRVLRGLLETLGQERDLVAVGSAGDAAAAWRLWRGTDPAVVLVDVLLPDRAAGLALVAELAGGGCPVVAMSIQSGLREAALSAGAVAFVDKGDGVDAILGAIRAVAGGPR